MVNMDETSVAVFYGNQKGNVMAFAPDAEEPVQWATRGQMRTCFTHCACICNDARVQKKLPQLFLVSERMLTVSQYTVLLQRCPPYVYIKRQKSAWNTEDITAVLVGVLKEHLRDELAEFDVILFMDAAKIHCGRKVFLACNRHNIPLLIIPAKLTWLLQMCDTHLFVHYKRHIRQRWQECAQHHDEGRVDIQALFDIVFDTIEHVMNSRSWEGAFKDNGFHSNFAHLSHYIMKQLEYTEKPSVNHEVPTLETFTPCFPGRSTIPVNLLLKPWRPAAHPGLPPLPDVQQLSLGDAGSSRADTSQLPVPPGVARGSRLAGRRPRVDRVAAALAAAPRPWTAQLGPRSSSQSLAPMPTDLANADGRTLPWQLRSQS